MSDPRTHYQVSFTAKQAMSLFVGLLFALGLAYFFGLMTGLSGRDGEPAEVPADIADASGGAALPTSPPGAVAGGAAGGELAFPAPVTAEPSAGGPTPAPRPRTVQLFEDRKPDSPPPRATAAPRAANERGDGFRIQVVSVSSRSDADREAARLTRQGFPARVEPASGPKGTVYRVRVGPFATREEAARATDRLAAAGRRETWIVPPGP
jgi:DedD protein